MLQLYQAKLYKQRCCNGDNNKVVYSDVLVGYGSGDNSFCSVDFDGYINAGMGHEEKPQS